MTERSVYVTIYSQRKKGADEEFALLIYITGTDTGKGDNTMKSLGIVRKIDELGRIVLPIETRKRLGIGPKDPVEIFVEKDRVVLKKYEPTCIFCGGSDDVILYKDKRICKTCIKDIKGSEL